MPGQPGAGVAPIVEVPAAPVRIAQGYVVALKLFDVAYEIDLKKVEALWANHPRPASTRARLTSTPAKAVSFGVPPVSVALERVNLQLDGVEFHAGVTARFYEFGVVTLALRIEAPPGPWDAFVALCNQVGHAVETAPWEKLLAELQQLFGAALLRPIAAPLSEDYLLAVINGFASPITAAELQERVDLAGLLSGETQRLSDGARQDLLRQRFSYYPNDLVALTWDRALIIEPRGDTDVAEVLEVANAQLLEMRYYDELLDAELPRMYDMVEGARGAANLLVARRYARLARRLHTLVAEVTELTEKVDNALQVTEDVYLARVYAAALDLFRVPRLTAAVDRKLAIIRETYTALHDEAQGSRAEIMEAAILLLIMVEIILALVRH
jgi:hypothetical protein